MKKIKGKNIALWDCTFYLQDDEGNDILNKDGSVKIFNAPKLDWYHIAECVELDDLEEVTQWVNMRL